MPKNNKITYKHRKVKIKKSRKPKKTTKSKKTKTARKTKPAKKSRINLKGGTRIKESSKSTLNKILSSKYTNWGEDMTNEIISKRNILQPHLYPQKLNIQIDIYKKPNIEKIIVECNKFVIKTNLFN